MPKKQPKRIKRRARKPRGVADWSGPQTKHGPFGIFSNVRLFYVVGVIIMAGSLAAGGVGVCARSSRNTTQSNSQAAAETGTPTPSPDATVSPTPTVEQVKQWATPPPMTIDPAKSYSATIRTEKGDIAVDLFAADAPNTVNDFVFLAGQGFYNDLPFYYVDPTMYVVTGDPSGTTTGGPGYDIPLEPNSRPFTAGTLGMINGSQFFILLDPSQVATRDYTPFGQVKSGMSVVQSLEKGDKVLSIEIQEQ